MLEAFNDMPIKQVGNGATIYMRDVAQVRDGSPCRPRSSAERHARGVLLTMLKNGNASTLDIVNQVKEMLPRIAGHAAAGAEDHQLFDQSLFVRAAVDGVVNESIIAACSPR